MGAASNVPFDGESVEISAGAILVQCLEGESSALLIRVRKEVYEVPKGHVEPGESNAEAAVRELREETGLSSLVTIVAEIGVVEYAFEHDGRRVKKVVHYFAAAAQGVDPVEFGPLPKRTRELRWVAQRELESLPMVSEDLRSIIKIALAR